MIDYDPIALDVRQNLIGKLQAAAREITLPLFATDIAADNKARTGYDPVTKADMACEGKLRQLIQNQFPDDSIQGEEFDDISGQNEWLWTLDPIDGTRGFMAGVPVWSTLIAVSYKNTPLLGLIDIPAQGKAFFGAPGRAWREEDNGTQTGLSTRSCVRVEDAVMGCTEPLSMLSTPELALYNTLRRKARFSRLGLDAFGYALVAQGRMDMIIEAGLKPCDVRALMPVIAGAGGALTNWQGGDAVDGGHVIAVGDRALLPHIYAALNPEI